MKQEQIDEIIRQYDSIKDLEGRETVESDLSMRNEFQRDYARILYSPSFRRLQGKMQINGVKSDAFYRNRLTHSLEVAQIATSIATTLSDEIFKQCEKKIYNNEDICVLQAAALGHDIGHPAFGHKGERVLNEIAEKFGLHFEGNAQNFRILRKIEQKSPLFQGLNLTHRTLLAINKYIVKEDNGVKKFMYKDDYDYFKGIREKNKLENVRTLDVQIIELADDIAYAVHDLEDGLHLRKFNTDEIIHVLKNKDENASKKFEEFVKQAKNYVERKSPNVQKYSKLFRLKLTSILTDKFVRDITIGSIDKKDAKEHGVNKDNQELKLDEYQVLLSKLKKAVFECSTRDPNIQEYERKGEIIIKSLFNLYTDFNKNNDARLLPPDYRPEELEKDARDEEVLKTQLIQNSIDYIAGMMDTYAISEYERLFNAKFDEIDLSQNITIGEDKEEDKEIKHKIDETKA